MDYIDSILMKMIRVEKKVEWGPHGRRCNYYNSAGVVEETHGISKQWMRFIVYLSSGCDALYI